MSRAAIRAPIRPTPNCSPRTRMLERDLHRLRHDAAARPLDLERSGPRGAARRQGRRDLLRRQVLGLSRPRRARDHARGKPRLDPRQRAAPPRPRAARCCSTASISSTATRPIRPTRWPAPRRPTRRARAGSCCATPMAARCRTRSRRSSARWSKHVPGDHVGIHAHNDTEQAVANSLAAVRAGARQIQGTLNGLGERCGNANLVSIIPTLKLKPEFADSFEIGVVGRAAEDAGARLARARRDAQPRAEPPRALCRRERLRHQGRHPCLGDREGPGDLRACRAGDRSATSARLLVSDQAGRSNVLAELERIGLKVDKDDPRIGAPARRGEGARGASAMPMRRPTPRSSCWRGACSARCRIISTSSSSTSTSSSASMRSASASRVTDGGGQGEGRRRDADLGGRGQRPGQRARRRAAQGPRQVPEATSRGSSSPTTACVSSTAAPKR